MTTGFQARTIQKQFGQSPVLLYLLQCLDQQFDLSAFTSNFLSNVWDITQAQGFGLDIWGRILGRSRYLQIAQTAGDNFGFSTNGESSSGQSWQPWSQAPFYGGAAAGTVAYALQDDYYRKLLLVKAAANIAHCDPLSINAVMMALFGDRGQCYCEFDPQTPMSIGYHFGFSATAVEQSIIQSGVIPVPAGMTPHYTFSPVPDLFFGFREANRGTDTQFVAGWNQRPFYSNSNLVSGAMLDQSHNEFILDNSKLG